MTIYYESSAISQQPRLSQRMPQLVLVVTGRYRYVDPHCCDDLPRIQRHLTTATSFPKDAPTGAPSPAPTVSAAPSYTPSDTPSAAPSEEDCGPFGGRADSNDSVCCPVDMCPIACGGNRCGAQPGGVENCCSSRVVDSGVLCSVSGAAPCILDGP